MWLRALRLLTGALAWRVAADAELCRLNDIPQQYTPEEEVQEVQLAGCEGLQDSLEDVWELRHQIITTRPVRRRHIRSLEWYRLYQAVERAPAQFGLEGYRSSLAPYLLEGVEGALAAADAAALRAVTGRNDASCGWSNVACLEVDGELRVTALALRSRDPGVWAGFSRLSALRALSLEAEIAEGVGALRLPALEILELNTRARDRCPHTELLFGEVVGRHTTLRVLSIIPGKYVEFRFDPRSYCGLTELREFHLPDMNIHSIPDCFGQMRELRTAYLACNYLTEPPRALANLSQLRAFISFRQGEWTPCHFHGPDRPTLLRGVRREECKPDWESQCGLEGDDSPHVLCPSVGLHGTVQGFMDLGWPRLQKLWLDGGFLSGPLPESLPRAWPDLVSLDLYQNDLSGPIPASLALLPFQKLQLQGNRLSGEVPAALWDQPLCYLNLAGNRELWGCAPPGRLAGGRSGFVGTGVSAAACGDGARPGDAGDASDAAARAGEL